MFLAGCAEKFVWIAGGRGEMASAETPPVSIRHGVRLVPDPGIPIEEVLLAVGDSIGHDNMCHASRMNKAVVVFMKEERYVNQLVEIGTVIRDLYVEVSPLATPSTRITVSGVPPFIPNQLLEQELRRFGKFASAFKTVGLGCKDPKLRHMQSLRRQVFMFLESPTQTLEVSFRVQHGQGHYMVYASSGSLKCFECGDVGHKRGACPHRQRTDGGASSAGPSAVNRGGEGGDVRAAPSSEERVVPPVGGGGPSAPSSVSEATVSGNVEPAVTRDVTTHSETENDTSHNVTMSEEVEPAVTRAVTTNSETTSTVISLVNNVTGDSAAGSVASQPNSEASREVSQANDAVGSCVVGTAANSAPGTVGSVAAPANSAAAICETSPVESRTDRAMEVQTSMSCSQRSHTDNDEWDGSEDDDASLAEAGKLSDLYSLDEINDFLDDSFGKTAKVSDYFEDASKFIRSATILQKVVGFDLLEEKKRFRLKKILTATRKSLNNSKKVRGKRTNRKL